VKTRRLDDRIRELCNQARVPQSAHELLTIITDLESALRERSNNRPRKSSAIRLVVRENGFFKERRASWPAQPSSRAQSSVRDTA
jgi:hypothetical protein